MIYDIYAVGNTLRSLEINMDIHRMIWRRALM